MRAARIHNWNTDPVIEELPDPVRLPAHTLLRIDAATVSHLDVTVASGNFTLRPSLPYVPGCEGAATVIESDTFRPGTQVIFRDGAIGLDRDGTWREEAVVPDEILMALDIELAPTTAATFFMPTTTAAVSLFEVGGLQPRQTVLISGATGAVGSMAVQLALQAEANVIALVSRGTQLCALPKNVVGVALDDGEAIDWLAKDRPADLLLDTIGGSGLSRRIGWVRFGGKVVCLGYTAGTEFTIDLPNWFFSDVAILPVNLMNHATSALKYAREFLPKIADGSLKIDVDEFSLEELVDALERLSAGHLDGRAVIRFN